MQDGGHRHVGKISSGDISATGRISPQRLTIYLISAHRAVIFAIAQLSCFSIIMDFQFSNAIFCHVLFSTHYCFLRLHIGTFWLQFVVCIDRSKPSTTTKYEIKKSIGPVLVVWGSQYRGSVLEKGYFCFKVLVSLNNPLTDFPLHHSHHCHLHHFRPVP